jgi:hypothetical protein
MDTFWDETELDFNDPLNQEIWDQSPGVQMRLQRPESLESPGSYGPQQAMIESEHRELLSGRPCLPWVPDLVGKDFRTAGRLAIVGSAYAGFIEEYSSRPNTMSIKDAAAESMERFQRAFCRVVVIGDRGYYSPLSVLAFETAPLARVAVLDLARVSLVRRGGGAGRDRSDNSKQCASTDEAHVFASYAESAESMVWITRRLLDSPAHCIVALGLTAEHGLLRLFAAQGCDIRRSDWPNDAWISRHSPWPLHYAGPKVAHWISGGGAWWRVECRVQKRRWGVLPAYHPARANRDPGYRWTRAVLAKMCADPWLQQQPVSER